MNGADGNIFDVNTTTGIVSAKQAKKSNPKNNAFSVPIPIFVIVIVYSLTLRRTNGAVAPLGAVAG